MTERKTVGAAQSAPAGRPITAVSILACIAVGVVLFEAHVAFVPVALALLFALVLSGPVEALHRWRVPRSLSAAMILILALAALGGVANLMWTPAQDWFKAAPQTLQTVKRKLAPATKFVAHVEALASNAGTLAAGTAGNRPPPPAPAVITGTGAAGGFLDVTREAVVSTMTFVIITLFLLAGGPPMLARMTGAFVNDVNAAHVQDVIEKVRGEVGRFYVTTTLINIGLGLATAGAMTLCGMPTPYLWGIMAGLLNFIPYAGAATSLTVVTIVAFVTFPDIGHVLAVAGSYLLIATVEGQLVQPLFVGRRLELNPLLIFLALWFGGLFWGIAGVILATPALVTLKVVAENARHGQAVLNFLGPNDQRPQDQRALGRLLHPTLTAKEPA